MVREGTMAFLSLPALAQGVLGLSGPPLQGCPVSTRGLRDLANSYIPVPLTHRIPSRGEYLLSCCPLEPFFTSLLGAILNLRFVEAQGGLMSSQGFKILGTRID